MPRVLPRAPLATVPSRGATKNSPRVPRQCRRRRPVRPSEPSGAIWPLRSTTPLLGPCWMHPSSCRPQHRSSTKRTTCLQVVACWCPRASRTIVAPASSSGMSSTAAPYQLLLSRLRQTFWPVPLRKSTTVVCVPGCGGCSVTRISCRQTRTRRKRGRDQTNSQNSTGARSASWRKRTEKQRNVNSDTAMAQRRQRRLKQRKKQTQPPRTPRM